MNFAKAVLTVSSMTILSRISGFVRDLLSASIIGAGPIADAFFVALRLPNLFRSLFAEGAFSAAFVPLYAKAMKEGGAAEAQRFAGEAISFLSAILLPFTFVMIVAMNGVMMAIAPGFQDRPDVMARAVDYARFTFPYLFLISGVALLSGVLNSHKRFAPGAAAPIAFNLLVIMGLLLAKPLNQDAGMMMAIAVTLSGIVQWLWMHMHCKAMGVAPNFYLPRLTERVKRLLIRVGPGALGAGAAQINLVVSTLLASLLPTGAVSYLFYADRLNQLPLGVIGIAISTTLLPLLSARVQQDDHGGIRHYTTRAFEFGVVLGLPASIGLVLSATPIVRVLYEHGAFTATDAAQTALALKAYALGIVPFILVKVLSTIFFANHNTRTPVKIALVAVAFNVIVSLLLIQSMGHVGIALAAAGATWVNCLLLLAALVRGKLMELNDGFATRMLRICLSNGVMGAALLLMLPLLLATIETNGKMLEIAALAGYLLLALLLYIVALRLTRAFDWAEVKAIINRKDEN